jgi:hypothetical protein
LSFPPIAAPETSPAREFTIGLVTPDTTRTHDLFISVGTRDDQHRTVMLETPQCPSPNDPQWLRDMTEVVKESN